MVRISDSFAARSAAPSQAMSDLSLREPAAAAAAAPAAKQQGQKRRLPQNANVLGKAMAIVSTEPQGFCKIDRHPCECVAPGKPVPVKCCFEIQIDASEYPTNPRGIVNLLGRNYATTLKLLQLIFLMGYLANQTLAPREKLVDGEADENGRKERPHKIKVPSDSQMCITFERVPHRDDPTVFVCYRWRFREYGPKESPSMLNHLVSLISDNATRKNKQMQLAASMKGRGAATQEEYMPTTLQITDWIALCEFHRPSLTLKRMRDMMRGETHQMAPNDIFQQSNAYWPGNAFNIEENLVVALEMGADPRYCDRDTYLERDGYGGLLQRWAEGGKNTWQISPESLDPMILHDRHMPFQVQNPLGFMPERAKWARAHKIPLEWQQRIFDATRNNSTRLCEENDIAALTHRIEAERAELLFKHRKNKHSALAPRGGQYNDVDDAYYSELLGLQSGKWEQAFEEIINPQGNCPPALQRIAEDLNGYLSINNHQMCIPQGQLFGNMPRFSNQRITEAITFNEIMTVATEHQSCVLFLYSALHVYSRVLLQCHHLMLGPPGIGKSFALLMLEQLLIKDTYRKYSYITPKGLAIPGKSQASLIMIIEDGQPSLLGVSGGSGGKPSAASSDIEALIKQFLTSLELQIQSVTMEPKRAGEFVRCETGCIMFIAMNDSSNLFPKAILDRFCVTLCAAVSNSESSDAATRLMAISERDASAIIKNVKIELKLWWSRKQQLHAYILHKETVGQLHPIDVSVADYLFGIVANFAEMRGLRMTTQRNVVRYRNVVRSFVVTNAIDLVWDSPQSRFRDVPFQKTHILAVNKYLFCTVEIAVFVIGLLSRMWQDNAYADLITTMKRMWFKGAAAKIATYHHLTPLNSNGSDPNTDDLHAPPQPDGYTARFRPVQVGSSIVAETNAKKSRKARDAAAAASSSQTKMTDAFASKDKDFAESCARFEEEKAAYDSSIREHANWGHMSARFGVEVPAIVQLGNHAPKVEDIIDHLATHISREMEKRYLPQEIRAKLTAMTTTPVTIQRERVRLPEHDLDNLMGQDVDSIPNRTTVYRDDRLQLLIENDCIRLAIPSLEHADSSKDVVMECLKQALTVLYGASLQMHDKKVAEGKPTNRDPHAYSQFLYGETVKDSDKRYIWRTIRIAEADARAVDVAKHSRVFNSAYAQPMTQKVMKGFLHSMDPAYVDPAVLFRLYDAETPWTIVNTDPDEMAALQRAEALGLSADDQHKVLPSNDPAIYNRAFRQYYEETEEEPPHQYPEDFSTHDAAFWAEELKTNPDQFCSSKVFDELLERQKQRPSIYDTRAPLPAAAMPSLEPPPGAMRRAVSAPAAAASSAPSAMETGYEDDEGELVDADELEAAAGMDLEDEDVYE